VEASKPKSGFDIQTFEITVGYTGKIEKAWDVEELFECAFRIVDAYEAARLEDREVSWLDIDRAHMAAEKALGIAGK